MKHILLVEDDAWLAELYKDVLQTLEGVTTHWAAEANSALELLDTQAVDLVLLDMFLPQHNGIEVLHELASHDDTINIPIVILSAVSEHDFAMSSERWREYGVVAYLYKPMVKPHQLAAAVQRQLLRETYK